MAPWSELWIVADVLSRALSYTLQEWTDEHRGEGMH